MAAWRHAHALTVVLPTPPTAVVERWRLAVHGDRAHLIVMPGTDMQALQQCVGDVLATRRTRVPSQGRGACTRPEVPA